MNDDSAITPNCRYGHGNLIKVTGEGKRQVWGLINPSSKLTVFVGELYVCTTCGYTEFFDNEPHITASTLSSTVK